MIAALRIYGTSNFQHKVHYPAQEIVTQGILMFCGECGTQNPDTNSFCKNCGKPLRKAGAAAAVSAPGAPVVPAPPVLQQPAGVPAVQPAAAPPAQPRNWLGAFSIILGVLCWFAYPYLLGIAAIALGGYSAYRIKSATGKIALLSVLGILIAAASMVVDSFYFILFPVNIMDTGFLGSSLFLLLT